MRWTSALQRSTPPCPSQQAHQALHQLAGAAHRPVHAVLALQRVDEAVDAGDRKRVAADQQALQAHGHAQLGVLEVRRHHGVQAAPAPHLEDGRAGLDEVAHGVEGLVAQGLEAQAVAVVGLGHEAFVPGGIARADAAHLGAHLVGVTAVVELVAVVEADAVERVERAQLDVVGQLAPGQRPQLFKQKGHGDDGRAGVEHMAVLVVHIGAATGRVELLQHGHAPAFGGQAHGRGQPTKAAADDHRVRCVGRGPGRRRTGRQAGCPTGLRGCEKRSCFFRFDHRAARHGPAPEFLHGRRKRHDHVFHDGQAQQGRQQAPSRW